MKLIIYNSQNVGQQKTGQPTIRINKKSGVIYFNLIASELLIKKGSKYIEFCQDQSRPTDWYILPGENTCGFMLRKDKNRESYVIRNRALSLKIMQTCGINEVSVRFLMAKEPLVFEGKEIYAILTKSAKL